MDLTYLLNFLLGMHVYVYVNIVGLCRAEERRIDCRQVWQKRKNFLWREFYKMYSLGVEDSLLAVNLYSSWYQTTDTLCVCVIRRRYKNRLISKWNYILISLAVTTIANGVEHIEQLTLTIYRHTRCDSGQVMHCFTCMFNLAKKTKLGKYSARSK
jgi:hypothetical protein